MYTVLVRALAAAELTGTDQISSSITAAHTTSTSSHAKSSMTSSRRWIAIGRSGHSREDTQLYLTTLKPWYDYEVMGLS